VASASVAEGGVFAPSGARGRSVAAGVLAIAAGGLGAMGWATAGECAAEDAAAGGTRVGATPRDAAPEAAAVDAGASEDQRLGFSRCTRIHRKTMSVSSWARFAADAEPAAAEAAGRESPLVASVLVSIAAIRQDAASARRARGGGRVDRGDARVQ